MTMNNDEIVCKCGQALKAHNNTGTWVRYDDHCFTDARLAALRAENAELRDKICGLETEVNEGGWMDKYNEKCRRVKELHAEIARLTPTETSAPPTKPGWYWRVNDEIDEWEPVHVRADLDGRLSTESRDDDGTVVIDLILHGKRWSKEPIPMPEIEKEGE